MRVAAAHGLFLEKNPPALCVSPADLSNLTSQKSQRGNPDWTLLDPQERPEPLPFYLACPPRTGQWPEALGGSGLRLCPRNTLVRMGPS